MFELSLPFILLPIVLLPVAAASGWFLARRHDRARRVASSAMSGSYFRGLNYLLNEQPDKAIEVFLKLAEVNQDTIDTHLALGSLFRRRGETDKAIRFHKHIITRPNLGEEQRSQALLELGEDYMRAGLLDRAERLFTELLDHDRHAIVPIRQLLDIYQQEKDWEKAIVQAQRLAQVDPEGSERLIAQFYCELAQRAVDAHRYDEALQALRQARRYEPRNARARMIEAAMAYTEGDWAKAAEGFRKACELNPDCFPSAIDRLVDCHRGISRLDDLEQWLLAVNERHPMASVTLAVARLKAEQGPEAAVDFLLEQLAVRPTARGLEYLMSLLTRHEESLNRVRPELVHDLMRRLLEAQPKYRCQHCGFSGTSHHWLCPSCRRWDTTRVITGVLGE